MKTLNSYVTRVIFQVCVFSIALFLSFLQTVEGQNYIVQTQFFGVKEGLSHLDVLSTHQDQQGIMWFGTRYGLNRFDGYKFKWYTKEKQGLQSNVISHILEDQEGWMWLIHSPQQVKSIDLFNPLTEEVISIEEKFGDNLPFKIDEIRSFAASLEGIIAFVVGQDKLVWYSSNQGFEVNELELYPIELSVFSNHQTIWGHVRKNENKLRDLIVEIDLQGKVRNRYEHSFPFQYNYIAGVDKEDNLWYLLKHWEHSRYEKTRYGKLMKIEPSGRETEVALENTNLPNSSLDLDVPIHGNEHGIWINPNKNNFWFHSRGRFQGFQLNTGWYQDLADSHTELTQSPFAYFDRDGRNWIGTTFGLFCIDLNSNPFQSLAYDPAQKNVLAFRGIAEDQHNGIWACIDRGEGWLGHFNKQAKNYTSNIFGPDKAQWGRGYKYGIFSDRRGNIWFGSGRENVITKYNPQDSSFQKFPYDPPNQRRTNIWSFYEDPQHQIWFGTDQGRIGYISARDSIIFLSKIKAISDKGGCIYQFFENQEGQTWIASDGGLYHLDRKDKSVRAHHPTGFDFLQTGLYHVHQDADGSLWMGTNGSGLFHWYPATGEYQQFTKADGLSDNTIYAVYEDKNNNLWMPSNYGIIKLNKNTYQTKAYLEKDGISGHEFNRISHYQSRDGTLFFGGINGLTAFHPRDLAGDSLSNDIPLVISSFHQFDGDQNKLVNRTAALRKSRSIIMRPDDRFFRIEFALLQYQDTKGMQYGYFIDGVDEDWAYQKENSIRISRLPYGKHRLKIKGQGNNGQWSKNELAISIIVLKPFYLQSWFLLGTVICLFLVGLLLYQQRIAQLQKRAEQLEWEVSNRTTTIRLQAEELKSLEQLKSRFFSNVSHELRTPLTLISGPVNRMMQRTPSGDQNYKLLQFVQRNTRQLLKLVNEILDLSKLESNKLEISEDAVQFYPYLQNQMAQFQSYTASEQLDFNMKYSADGDLRLIIDKTKFEKIIHNFLANAIKFTPPQGKVVMKVTDNSNTITIEIVDNGIGIHPEDLPHIFNRFYQSRLKDTRTEVGTGIGLSLCKELAELLGGRVWAESEPNLGSRFFFTFPKKLALIKSDFNPISDEVIKENPIMSSGSTPTSSSVLLVEDNSDMREYLSTLLSNYHIITAENGQAAWDWLQSNLEKGSTPDIIIADLMMPVMNGFELLNRIKSDDRFRHLPVIMLTAKTNIRVKLQALRIGVDDYLLKPFEEEELIVRIETLLRNYQERINYFSNIESNDNGQQNNAAKRRLMAQVDLEWLSQLEKMYKKYLADKRLNVDFIARQTLLSPRQFHRRLKSLTGLTPNQYLQEFRLQSAYDYLLQGQYATVKEVSFAVGFSDFRYFSRLFSQRFGTLPSKLER